MYRQSRGKPPRKTSIGTKMHRGNRARSTGIQVGMKRIRRRTPINTCGKESREIKSLLAVYPSKGLF
jgi:hypothetical protein